MDDAGIAMVEQPLPFWNKDGMAALCSRLRMAVVADEGLWDLHDAYAAFKSGATALYGVQIGKGGDRKSVVSGKSVSVRVDLGGRRIIKKKKTIDRKETQLT